ncbi:C-type mannose receptor 2-like [Pomacea canaliculata]|uniref:C-type mannose receptor 2-like n=1 Tax=Pomacea canaliculata TaxID=400727 RepID=UPI000D739AC4|nr:C-type mannose receptor 2-like [Pomacea canaliculata]
MFKVRRRNQRLWRWMDLDPPSLLQNFRKDRGVARRPQRMSGRRRKPAYCENSLRTRENTTGSKRVSSRWLVGRISTVRSTWEWVDSTTVFSSLAIPWEENELSPDSDRDCAEMDYSGLLNDAPCHSLLPYICEKPLMDHSKTCDFMWDLLNGICYVHFTRAMSWSDAQESCQKSGSNLLSINSLDERTWVLRMLKAKSRRWWVGLQRTSPGNDTWKWLDSVTDFSSHVTPWGTNEPNNMGGDEDCAEISPRGQLNDESCSESFGFICEKSSNATPENRAEKCGMDWIFFKNACYKLSTNQMIWSQARKKCEEGGANLLSINSVDEMIMIQSEIRKVSERWWIGLKRTPGLQTKSPTDLLSHAMAESYCVEMTPGGFLSYTNCSDIRQFICEDRKGQVQICRENSCFEDFLILQSLCVTVYETDFAQVIG